MPAHALLRLPLLALALASACSSSQKSASSTSADAGDVGLGDYDPVPFGGSRPVKLYVPSGYTGAPVPLVILLHGYSSSGAEEDLYLGLRAVAESKTTLYAHPDGTTDPSGNEFWNATNACCNFYGSGVDDSTYLESLVAEIGTRYTVDLKRRVLHRPLERRVHVVPHGPRPRRHGRRDRQHRRRHLA